MKAISYSLFGYERERAESCFDFNSYLRGLMICIRMNRLLYPEWTNILNLDKATYFGFKDFFDALVVRGLVINKNEDGAALCEGMLWRLKPVFDMTGHEWRYTHVLCRDLDSPATYREVQAVNQWITNDKCLHAIADSVSHIVPLMGGMIGIRPNYFTERMGRSWSHMMNRNTFDLSNKGADQDFLNTIIYPTVAKPGEDSITQHYVLGMGNTFLSDYHSAIDDIDVGLPLDLKESNSVCGHIGAAGWYETSLFKFLRNHWQKFEDLVQIEKLHPKIFYWT